MHKSEGLKKVQVPSLGVQDLWLQLTRDSDDPSLVHTCKQENTLLLPLLEVINQCTRQQSCPKLIQLLKQN